MKIIKCSVKHEDQTNATAVAAAAAKKETKRQLDKTSKWTLQKLEKDT